MELQQIGTKHVRPDSRCSRCGGQPQAVLRDGRGDHVYCLPCLRRLTPVPAERQYDEDHVPVAGDVVE
jgi:ribosomal protein S14